MYLKDPGGNIGELISRHTLDNDSDRPFGVDDLLCVSEIGTPVDDPNDLALELKAAFDLDMYGDDSMFIGDENGLFVAVPIGRFWIPENSQEAKDFPAEIHITKKGPALFKYKDYPYDIVGEK